MSEPRWKLSSEWGVGTDPYNWILYRKGKKTWRAAGYYHSAEFLLQSFFRKLTRTEPQDLDLVQHVERCSEAVRVAGAALFDEVSSRPWPNLTRPQRSRNANPKENPLW